MPTHVLLIDDNADQAVITKRTLESSGDYAVDAAPDTAQGLAHLQARPYDVVLCDYRLPGMTGVEFLRALKQRPCEVPVIIVTSAGNERIAVEAMQEGAYDYVIKDLNYASALAGVIQRSLIRYREKQERLRVEAERNRAIDDLRTEKHALEKMNQLMMDREDRILELKEEINVLLNELGQKPKYESQPDTNRLRLDKLPAD